MPLQKISSKWWRNCAKFILNESLCEPLWRGIRADWSAAWKSGHLKGEFIDGKYMRVHRTIGSTAWISKLPTHALKIRLLICWNVGNAGLDFRFWLSPRLAGEVWKEILKNHAHDSIGCCCSDKFIARLSPASNWQKTWRIIYSVLYAQNSRQHAAERRRQTLLFNPMPWPREEVINTTVRLAVASLICETVAVSLCHILFECPWDRSRPYWSANSSLRQLYPFMEFDIQISQIVPSMGYRRSI